MAKGRKTGGRARGTPNRVTAEVRQACGEIVDDPAYRSHLLERARAGKLAPGVECMLWYYAKGKPREEVAVNGDASVLIAWDDRE